MLSSYKGILVVGCLPGESTRCGVWAAQVLVAGEARVRKWGHDRSLSPIPLKEGHLAKPCTRKSIVAWKSRGPSSWLRQRVTRSLEERSRIHPTGQTCSCSWKACDAIDVILWLSPSATVGSLLRHVPTARQGLRRYASTRKF